MSLPVLRGVVFDMDGTLVDSEAVYVGALRHALGALGLPVRDAFCHRVTGLPGPAVHASIREEYGEDFPFGVFSALYFARRDELAGEGIPLKPGAREILDHVSALGCPVGLATSAQRAPALATLGRLHILRHFHVVVTREDVERTKPAPDLFLLACQALSVPPGETLAIEDSINGVLAALAAGMPTVMVPDMAVPTAELRARCHAVCRDLDEVRSLLPSVSPHLPSRAGSGIEEA